MGWNDLINEIEQLIKQYPDSANELKSYSKQWLELQQRLNQEQSLVFIAEKGVGKTTLINFILGLNYSTEKLIRKKKRKVEDEVLETGSGATTTSEVEILQSKDGVNHIIINPYSLNEMESIIKNFCKNIFEEVHHINLSAEELPPELKRACINMTGLKEEIREVNIGSEIQKLRVNLAKELATSFSYNDYKLFEQQVLKKANLSQRTRINYTKNTPSASIDEEKVWIKKMFRDLNLVKLQDAPLAKRITIELSQEVFDFSLLNGISKIIDTRGLEAGSVTDRMDIKDYFTSETNDFLFLIDEFKKTSPALIQLLNQYVYDKDFEIVKRLGYIVNFKEGEPERVIGCDGECEDESAGILYKRDNLLQLFKDNQVYIEDKQIIYTNPKRSLDVDGLISVDRDEEEEYGSYEKALLDKKYKRKKEQEDLLKAIFKMVEDYRSLNEKKLLELENKFQQLKETINERYKLNLESVIKFVKSYKFKFLFDKEVEELYQKYLSEKYASTIHAINNRYGIYNEINIYCEGANYLTRKIQMELKQFKDSILVELHKYRDSNDLMQNQLNNLEFLERDLNEYLDSFVKKLSDKYNRILKEDIFNRNDEEFWSSVKGRWGGGAGYKEKVKKDYRLNILNKQLKQIINQELVSLFDSYRQGCLKIIDTID